MINSMTGFGRGQYVSEAGTFVVEIKSVNHRYAEIKVYVPREMSALELPLTRKVKERVARGKIDIALKWTPSPQFAGHVAFNVPLLERYEVEIAVISGNLQRNERIPLDFLLALPGVMEKASNSSDDDEFSAPASLALNEALIAFSADRAREGEALAAEIKLRLASLESLRESIAGRVGEVVEAYRKRLSKKAEEWAQAGSVQIDSGRLEAEVLMFADRSDITEELVRLQAHLAAFRQSISGESAEPQGKPMEFLTQELLREVNTIASKSRDTAIASTVLTMKNEIEKAREQVLNIE